MKQKILIIAVVSALLSTSCLKEGDLDRFRHDMSDVTVSYRKVMERLEKAFEQ